MASLARRRVLELLLNAPALLVACSASESGPPPTETAPPTATATPLPSPTPRPLPSPTPAPPALELRPPQVAQGGSATVVLNDAAPSATATFQGRQYPMLAAAGRLWAVIGTGGFTTPGPYALGVLMPAGPARPAGVNAINLTVTDARYPVESIELDAQTAALLAPDIVQNELNRRAAIYSVYTMQRLWTGPFLRPNGGPLSSLYGLGRSYNGAPATDYHRGTDFAGDPGSPVSAAAAGRVAFVGLLQVRGNSVIVDHGAGVFTAYHHLSRIDVAQGQTVAAGQQVGALGATGLVTGPHLHWEVVVRGIEVDGLGWLKGVDFGL